jgi:hypothetical protein
MKTNITIHEYFKYSAFKVRHLQHSVIVYHTGKGEFYEARIRTSLPIKYCEKKLQKFMRHVPMWEGRFMCTRYKGSYR